MRYLSVCSGVEAASVAWEHLGWTPVGFSEIESFPSAVLAHRFPSVKNFGDMTKYKEWDIEPGTVDVLVGGTPCQSFSVAGLRKGLDDPRGNLMLVYLGLAEHLRVPWLVWENVPGVLSSNGGRDFGTFLGALGELGYRWSFRVLDAQHFGVPQRRRRVFVVAHLGDGPHPAQVLFEPESLRGDSAKSGKARKGAPRGAGKGAASGGRVGVDVVGTLCSDTHPGAYSGQDAYTGRLVPQFFDEQASGSQYGTSGVASTCSRRDHKDATDLVVTATGPAPLAFDGYNQTLSSTTQTLRADKSDGDHVGMVLTPVTATGPVTHARTHPSDGSEERTRSDGATKDGTGRGTPIVPTIAFHPTQDPISSVEVTHAMGTDSRQGTATVAVAFDTTQITSPKNYSSPKPGDPCHPLAAGAHPPAVVTGTLSSRSSAGGGLGTDFEVAGGLQAVPMVNMQGSKSNAVAQEDGPSYTLNAMHGHDVHAIVAPTLTAANDPSRSPQSSEVTQQVAAVLAASPTMAVRRLLPVECERLQGFPTVTESVRLTVCFDPTRKSARVAVKCRKWQGNASSADGVVCPHNVELAAQYLSANQAVPETLAVLAVRQNSVTVHPALPKTERWNEFAKSAAQSSAYLPPTEAGNTAQELARLAHALGVEATHGRVESLPPSDSSLLDVNGKQSVDSCGQDTADFVVDVTFDQNSDTFTTFALGRISPKAVSTRATLCCSALHVIAGCIPDATLPESFCIDLMVESEWTLIPWKNKPASECPDGPRYKAMGNSMAVPVMRWIGERLDRVARGES